MAGWAIACALSVEIGSTTNIIHTINTAEEIIVFSFFILMIVVGLIYSTKLLTSKIGISYRKVVLYESILNKPHKRGWENEIVLWIQTQILDEGFEILHYPEGIFNVSMLCPFRIVTAGIMVLS